MPQQQPEKKETITQLWRVSTATITKFVHAANQFEAWDSLRDRPATEFGLITEAEPNESGDPFLVRTSVLMFRWKRDADAEQFIELGTIHGMPRTTKTDREAAAASLCNFRPNSGPP